MAGKSSIRLRLGMCAAVVALAAILIGPATPAAADDKYWLPITGDWSDPANWDPAGAPSSGDYACIDNDGTATIASAAQVYDILAGDHNTGAVVHTGGTYDIADRLYLGWYAGSTGLYELQSGELNVGDLVRVGVIGTGSFTQTGGTHNVLGSLLGLGAGSGATGVYDLQDGLLSVALDVEVGQNGTGTFIQSGGTHSIGNDLSVGVSSSSATGVYELQAGELTVGDAEHLGYYGTGSFIQTGGTHLVVGCSGYFSHFYLGYYTGSTGIYNLQDGTLSVDVKEGLGLSGTGRFIQTGGIHTLDNICRVGCVSGSTGVYDLQAGEFTLNRNEYLGDKGTGSFTQTGGTHAVEDILYMGYRPGSTGVYDLEDGQLNVNSAYVGWDPEATGSFTQSGGTHTAEYVSIGAQGRYELSGGVLNVEEGLCVLPGGVFDFAGGTGAVYAPDSSIVAFSQDEPLNAEAASLSVGANSLTVFPVGSDPQSVFGSFTTQGMTHVTGTTLTVSAGEGFAGRGELADFVNCQGTVGDGESPITLLAGVFVSGAGQVELGWEGELYVDARESGISGGSLSTWNSYVGYEGTGTFTQTGGTHRANSLELGEYSGATGLYELQAGQLTVQRDASIGDRGTGTFTQTGGTYDIGYRLFLGGYPNSTGVYELSGGQLAVRDDEHVGTDMGTGTFTQTGGTHCVGRYLFLSNEADSIGVYELHSGQLTVGNEEFIGYLGTGRFTQSDGTHSVGGELTLGKESGSVGTYDLQGGVLSASTITPGEGSWAFNFTGGTLHADEVECFLFNDGGILAPGESIGTTMITGSYTQNAGELEIELAGLSEFDTLTVSGSAALGGSLNVLGFEGYRPNEGDSFEVITAGGGFAGDFSEIVSNITMGIPEGLAAFTGGAAGSIYEVTFNGLTCGDANGDHRASLGDLCIMAGNWNQSGKMWAEGDFNGDGIVSLGDLCMLAGNWNWELPSPAPIPEPATLSLLALAGLAALRRRQATR